MRHTTEFVYYMSLVQARNYCYSFRTSIDIHPAFPELGDRYDNGILATLPLRVCAHELSDYQLPERESSANAFHRNPMKDPGYRYSQPLCALVPRYLQISFNFTLNYCVNLNW